MKVNLFIEGSNTMAKKMIDEYTKPKGKKTAQGMGRNTKFSHKRSKRYIKRKRGQG
jgi:hypothetical protein